MQRGQVAVHVQQSRLSRAIVMYHVEAARRGVTTWDEVAAMMLEGGCELSRKIWENLFDSKLDSLSI